MRKLYTHPHAGAQGRVKYSLSLPCFVWECIQAVLYGMAVFYMQGFIYTFPTHSVGTHTQLLSFQFLFSVVIIFSFFFFLVSCAFFSRLFLYISVVSTANFFCSLSNVLSYSFLGQSFCLNKNSILKNYMTIHQRVNKKNLLC